MAFRAASQLRSMMKNRGRSNFATTPDLSLNPAPDFKAKLKKGDFMPVGFVLGMVTVATSLGIYTALHQLHSAPNVHVKKSRRETIPEVVEAEQVAAEAETFVKKSFFRKVAHLKDKSQQVVPNPIAGDICSRPLRVETLSDIGIESKS